MRIVIEFEEQAGVFNMTSDGGNFATIAALEIAKASVIKQGMEKGGPARGGLGMRVRRVDAPE